MVDIQVTFPNHKLAWSENTCSAGELVYVHFHNIVNLINQSFWELVICYHDQGSKQIGPILDSSNLLIKILSFSTVTCIVTTLYIFQSWIKNKASISSHYTLLLEMETMSLLLRIINSLYTLYFPLPIIDSHSFYFN